MIFGLRWRSTKSYGYDKANNLIWKKNGNCQETCFSYDSMNRVTQQVYYTGTVTAGQSGQCSSIPQANLVASTPSVTFTYDSGATNAIGRLVSVTRSAATNQIRAMIRWAG